MKKQKPKQRIKNFNEVAFGMSEKEAIREATRCISCKKAKCSANCPVEIDIPGFINAIKHKKFSEAIRIIKEKNNLPGVCGRVCPQENQCEGACILQYRKVYPPLFSSKTKQGGRRKSLEGYREAIFLNAKGTPINIGALERFAADWELKNRVQSTEYRVQRKGKKVAIIGSGPAGLTCAGDLAKLGYRVSVFEALHAPGGVLVYGIPEFRLPKDIVKKEIEYLKSLGVEIKTNFIVGKTTTLKELFNEGCEALFIATGAGLPNFMNIPGENLNRVYSSNELLTRVNLMKAYLFPSYDTPVNIGKKVAVVGGGNTAMDSARVSLRLGAEKVYIVYRRSEKEMPARKEEIGNAKEEGIEFHTLVLPKKILGDKKGFVKGMECIRMKLGEPDETGRGRPVCIEKSEFTMDVDTVVVAIGQSPNPVFIEATPELKVNKWNKVIVDSGTQAANLKGVYAGGDATMGDDTVIAAMGAGKRAARAMDRYLKAVA